MLARVVVTGTAVALLLSGCSSMTSTPAASSTAMSTTEPSATLGAASPTPTPAPVALTAQALHDALLTAADLGRGWKVTKREQKQTRANKKSMEEYSPECLDFVTFLYGTDMTQDDPTSAYVEISKGKNFEQRTVTDTILPMPEGGFPAFQAQAETLLEECPSITTQAKGNDMGMSMAFKTIDVPGYDDIAFGMEGDANAIFFQYYWLWAAAPVGDNIVLVSSAWSQKSRKYLASVLTKAVDKVAAAAGVDSPLPQASGIPAPLSPTPTPTPSTT